MRLHRFFGVFLIILVLALVLGVTSSWIHRHLWGPRVSNPATAALPASEGGPRFVASKTSQFDTKVVCANFYKTICQNPGETMDPTGWVRPDYEGELRAQRLVEDLSHKHPDWESDQIDEALVKLIYTPRRRARIQSAYHWVQLAMERFIDRQPEEVFNQPEKKMLKSRIRKTALELPPPASVYSDEPDLFTKSDVYYERTFNGDLRMRVGGAYLLSTKSWFNFIFTFAHEFAHSIDPCELRNARIAVPAFDRLTGCFLRQGLVATPRDRSECAEMDHLSETFADWFAVQIVAEALQTFANVYRGPQLLDAIINSVRDICDQGDDGEREQEFHPSPQVRIDLIFGRHPAIRDLLGCEKPSAGEAAYCDMGYSGGH